MISAHDLSIKRGRYFRPRIPCAMQSGRRKTRSIFFLFCSKYTDLRITLFDIIHLKIQVLKLNTIECFEIFYDFMSPSSDVVTKCICKFIQDALGLR